MTNSTTTAPRTDEAPTPIVVVGAGPVGMTLALEAAGRGARVTVVEARPAGAGPSAKCNTVAARTLETFRRLGLADAVRAAGLPDDFPTDVIYTTSLTGPELTRIELPSRNERSRPGFIDSDWNTPEPMVRISQLFLEPILRAALDAEPNVTVLDDTAVTAYVADHDLLTVSCRRGDGSEFTLDARYLVGCDGGRSTIRKQMGASLDGDAELGRTRTTLVRSTEIGALFGERRPAWMSWIINDKVRGNVVAIDGRELWLLHRAMPDADMAYEELDFHRSILDLLGVDQLDYEVVHHEDWTGRRLVAERFRDGNVFIAGDAAHLWVPFAGYGMNAGIADGVHLAWLLSAVVNGWASPDMLDAYEAERLPITEQVSRHAMAKVLEYVEALSGGAVPAELADEGEQGAELRGLLGPVLHEMNVPQFAPEGLNFGYYYEDSPIIMPDGSTAPDYTMGTVTPSTVPGCRMPSFEVDGRPILDLLGPDYTLVRFEPSVDVSPIRRAAAEHGLPLTLIDAARPADDAFTTSLILTRYDQHVVWRGDCPPADADTLVLRLTGHAT